MKKKLIIGLAIFLILAGYVYASYNNLLPENIPTIPKEKIEEVKTNTPTFNSVQGETQTQLEIFSARARELGSYAQEALKTGIQEDNSQPVHEKAIEYGQYIYCKQVVESYEVNQPNQN